ncbi:MAG: hypothetical protein U1D99_05060 [Candidatus Omnitrophota bacterium]|nr:hypothetical protein [Candidatus Omnitrophota bacterium]
MSIWRAILSVLVAGAIIGGGLVWTAQDFLTAQVVAAVRVETASFASIIDSVARLSDSAEKNADNIGKLQVEQARTNAILEEMLRMDKHRP